MQRAVHDLGYCILTSGYGCKPIFNPVSGNMAGNGSAHITRIRGTSWNTTITDIGRRRGDRAVGAGLRGGSFTRRSWALLPRLCLSWAVQVSGERLSSTRLWLQSSVTPSMAQRRPTASYSTPVARTFSGGFFIALRDAAMFGRADRTASALFGRSKSPDRSSVVLTPVGADDFSIQPEETTCTTTTGHARTKLLTTRHHPAEAQAFQARFSSWGGYWRSFSWLSRFWAVGQGKQQRPLTFHPQLWTLRQSPHRQATKHQLAFARGVQAVAACRYRGRP